MPKLAVVRHQYRKQESAAVTHRSDVIITPTKVYSNRYIVQLIGGVKSRYVGYNLYLEISFT
jgi:hypothetical protein